MMPETWAPAKLEVNVPVTVCLPARIPSFFPLSRGELARADVHDRTPVIRDPVHEDLPFGASGFLGRLGRPYLLRIDQGRKGEI